jgi:outer membrane protein assembly complex protein YaeT
MDEQPINSDTLFPHETGHHRSSRERQRRGPMWGCLRMMAFTFFGIVALIVLFVIALPFVATRAITGNYVARRIEATLQTRLGREVKIGRLQVVRTGYFEPTKVILHDVQIANAPGGINPFFARVARVEITGGLGSFWNRRVEVERIDIIHPHINFEVFPEGSALTHNFPRWQRGPKRAFEIYRLEFDDMFVRDGHFIFLDRRRDMVAEASAISSDITITSAENLYAGVLHSPRFVFRLQDYEPLITTLRGGFRFTPGVLELQSIALRGQGVEAFVSGRMDPLADAAYDLSVRASVPLETIRRVFRVEPLLAGPIILDTRLRGKAGDFRLTGAWRAPSIAADTYELTDASGGLDVTGDRTAIRVERATYGGGTISADYELPGYQEPYPMSVKLDYDGISVEQLFADWGVENTGLRAAATGSLRYGWNKDDLLGGTGSGSARLSRNAVAFSSARYPIPVAGATEFTLDRGVVGFRNANLETPASQVAIAGSLRIENIVTELQLTIDSSDFSELDRLAYNFAHAAGKRDFELLGLGGLGRITGTVRGPIDAPDVVARISARGTRFNDVPLGSSEIALRYQGRQSVLTFDRAIFTDELGRLELTGTVTFPDRGPSPLFDLAVTADNYSVERAIAAAGLDFTVGPGRGTGTLTVSGSPEQGTVRFGNMLIRRDDGELRLNGLVAWSPGEGNVRFDLDIGARDFAVADIVSFLDLAGIPVTGQLTGTLHIEGPKNELEGAGSITVRNGTIFGERVDTAVADIAFDAGRLRATNVTVTSPAGQITGEADYDFESERFGYTIESSSIDLAQLEIFRSLREMFGGRIRITSSGAGTMDNPELVVQAELLDGAVQGIQLPAGSPPPSLYIAIREGRLVIRGSIDGIVTIEGNGSVGTEMAVEAAARITVHDVARLLSLSPRTATIPAGGNMIVDVRLGGRLTPLDALVAEVTFPEFNLRVSEEQLVPAAPLRLSLRNGRLAFDQFALTATNSAFVVTGFAGITGDQPLAVALQGVIHAELLQLFVTDMRADGRVEVNAAIRGTFAQPAITGRAELVDAQVKFAGFPQLIDNISGLLLFHGDRIEIQSLRATIGGGNIVAGGNVALDGLTPQRVQIALQGDDVTLRYYEGLAVTGDFALQINGDAERAIIQGDVTVARASYTRDFDLQQSILNVLLERRGITPVVTAPWQERVILRVNIAAPNAISIDNNIADVTGSADLELAGTLANPVILGLVELDEGGTVTFQNIDYRLTRGTINFQNPFRIDPFFDITLEGQISGATSEQESGPIDVTVNITGTLDRISPSITSDPPTSDITLFTLLGFGNLTSEGGPLTGTGAALGQSLVVGTVVSSLGSRIFPFAESFTYDPGLLETGSGAGPKVTFETRISNDVRLLVVYNLDSHKSREVIEWQASRVWTVQFTRDEGESEYRAEARFRRRYTAQWTWGDRGRQTEEVFPLESVAEAVSGDDVRVAPLPPPTRVAPLEPGLVLRDLDVRADGAFETQPLRDLIDIEPGDVVTRRALQSAIRALYATGNFRDVRVEGERTNGTVDLTFALSIHYRIGNIDIEGVTGPNMRRAERRLGVRLGDVLSLNDVDETAVAIQEELRDYGFLGATVDPETIFRREMNRAEVIFHVTTGPEARVGSVGIEGEYAPFVQTQLLARMRQQPGRVFRAAEARSDADRIREFLFREDYRRAQVEFVDHVYNAENNTVDLRYRIVTGPVVRVEVAGVPRRAVRRQLPFRDDEEGYSEDAVEQAAEAMVRSYQLRGHFNATVDTESRLENGVWTTTFHVDPGPRFRLAGVTFSGNETIPDKELRGVIETTTSGGIRRFLASLFRRPTGVTREQLAEDRDALEGHYRLQGFSQAAIGRAVVNTRADGTMVVDFPITEGPRTMVAAVDIEGAERLEEKSLPDLALEPGQPLNPQTVREDVVRLQTHYAQRGFAEVQVSSREVRSDDLTSANVTYLIAEGPRVEIGDVIVRGNTYTDSEVILRTADLKTGQPFTFTGVLEAQRNLYRLGSLQRADVRAEAAGTAAEERNVVVSVEEGRNLTATGSAGLRYESTTQSDEEGESQRFAPRFAGALSHRNLFGTGRFLGVEAVWSRDEREAYLTYREPFIGRFNVPLQFRIYQNDDGTVPQRQFEQRGTSIEISKVTRASTRWSVQYEYKISDCVDGELCDEADQIFVPGLDPALLDIEISSITPTVFWDRRNDIINPHTGFFTSASVEYAFPLFSAEANFTKEFLQGVRYFPIGRRNVFVVSARIGFIQPMGEDDPLTPDDESRFAPVAERFTAGGDTSHRAYPRDLLGTLCDPFTDPNILQCEPTLVDLDDGPGYELAPLGGNSLFLVNAEYRFPIFSNFGGTLFVDSGNVYASPSIDFRELRWGVGVGFRYLSPVGPLRVDVGWPLNRPVYFERSFNYSITLGYAF